MLEKGDPMFGYVADGYWCDIGNLPDYMRANARLAPGPGEDPVRRQADRAGASGPTRELRSTPGAQIFGPIYLATRGQDSKKASSSTARR